MLLAAVLAPLGSTTIAVALPAIGSELAVSPGRLDLWLVGSYLVVSVVGTGVGGGLGDRFGHERTLRCGLAVSALGALLGSIATGLAGLACARVLMAAGGALTMPAVLAMLRNRTAAERRARAFGVLGGALGLAAALGPLVGGALVERFGWRTVFYANLPVLAAAASLTAQAVTERRVRSATGGAVVSLRLAFDPQPLREPGFAAGSAVVALHNLAMYALLYSIPVALTRATDAGPSEIGRVLLAMLAAMVVGAPLGGRLAERIGARGTALAGSLAALLGLALLPDPDSVSNATAVLPGLVALGWGFGLASAPAQSSAMGAAGERGAGSAGGVLTMLRYAGGLAGIGLLSLGPAAGGAFATALVTAALASLLLPGRTVAAKLVTC
jgi:MFS family permease